MGGRSGGRVRARLSHVDADGRVRMVDVGGKPVTERVAVARGHIAIGRPALRAIRAGRIAKGDPLQAARIAGIMAAKKTADLVPLCHPLSLSHVDVDLRPRRDGYEIEARVHTSSRTGVEMEALTAVSVAALTVYDMVKANRQADGHRRGAAGSEDRRSLGRHSDALMIAASAESTPMDDRITTLAQLPFHTAGRYPKAALIRRCQGTDVEELSSREFFDRIRDLGLGLGALGVVPGDRVAILSESRPEWLIADFAVLTGGGVSVPIYPNLPEAQVRYILADSGAGVVLAADEALAAKVRAVWSELPGLRALVVIDPSPGDVAATEPDREELSLDDAIARGHQRLMTEDGLGREYKEAAMAIPPDQLATIIYTSGTTGEPKGVMLTHGNVASNVLDAGTVVGVTDTDDALSFLPLSHAFERTVVCLYLYNGVTVTFAESLETIARDLLRVRPTVMTGVPRVYEKLHARIHDAVADAPAARRKLFHWAVGVGLRRARAELAGRAVPLLARLQLGLADRLVLSKIRARLGGRIRFLVSGSAPLLVPVAEFLFAIGVPVLEGYGLTETAPVLTVNPAERPKLGTVGTALPHVTLRIAEDGEVLARGPNVMQGYYRKQQATDEVMRDGWFHTGDIGRLDADGYLAITDRKKDLIVTAGGKNVAPSPIEAELKRAPIVAEAVLVGDRRPYIAALIVPDLAALASRTASDPSDPLDRIVTRPEATRLFADVVERVNADLPRYEQIKRFVLLPVEFSVESGELTPTLKVKRRVVAAKWTREIDGLYAS